MSEHHENTEFLKHCLRYHDSPERDHLLKHLVLLQQELRIFRNGVRLVILLMVPALPALVFSNLWLQNLSEPAQRAILNVLVAINFGLLASLFIFSAARMRLRLKLHREREKCRQVLKRVLADRFGTEAPSGQ